MFYQAGLIIAIIIFVIFILLHTENCRKCLESEIPDPTFRIITIGLIIAVMVFLLIGCLMRYHREFEDEDDDGDCDESYKRECEDDHDESS